MRIKTHTHTPGNSIRKVNPKNRTRRYQSGRNKARHLIVLRRRTVTRFTESDRTKSQPNGPSGWHGRSDWSSCDFHQHWLYTENASRRCHHITLRTPRFGWNAQRYAMASENHIVSLRRSGKRTRRLWTHSGG